MLHSAFLRHKYIWLDLICSALITSDFSLLLGVHNLQMLAKDILFFNIRVHQKVRRYSSDALQYKLKITLHHTFNQFQSAIPMQKLPLYRQWWHEGQHRSPQWIQASMVCCPVTPMWLCFKCFFIISTYCVLNSANCVLCSTIKFTP